MHIETESAWGCEYDGHLCITQAWAEAVTAVTDAELPGYSSYDIGMIPDGHRSCRVQIFAVTDVLTPAQRQEIYDLCFAYPFSSYPLS